MSLNTGATHFTQLDFGILLFSYSPSLSKLPSCAPATKTLAKGHLCSYRWKKCFNRGDGELGGERGERGDCTGRLVVGRTLESGLVLLSHGP